MIFVVERTADNGMVVKEFSSGVHAHMVISTHPAPSGKIS